MDGIYSANGQRQPSSDAVLTALQSLLASDSLRLSERNRRFLSFVVKQAVEGQAERIKAYSIGVDVFGRDDSFDPTLDPIVRIEATRLRSALTAYYDGPGRSENIRISIPRGSYIPVFSCSLQAQGNADELCRTGQSAACDRATIVIHDHSGEGDPEAGLKSELFVDALLVTLRQERFRVRILPANDRSAALSAINALFANPGTACSLDITVRILNDGQRYSWRLVDLATSEVLTSNFQAWTTPTTPCPAIVGDFAATTARTISDLLRAREHSVGGRL